VKSVCRRRARVLLAFVLGCACSKSGDPVRECLDALVSSAHDRDAAAFFDRVSADFQAADGSGRADAEATLRRYFAGYEILDVSIRDVTVEKGEDAARVRFRADLSGQPRKLGGLDAFLPRTSSYDFDLRMVPEGGKWKVAWASWQPHGGG
jgi:hypothetical protein